MRASTWWFCDQIRYIISTLVWHIPRFWWWALFRIIYLIQLVNRNALHHHFVFATYTVDLCLLSSEPLSTLAPPSIVCYLPVIQSILERENSFVRAHYTPSKTPPVSLLWSSSFSSSLFSPSSLYPVCSQSRLRPLRWFILDSLKEQRGHTRDRKDSARAHYTHSLLSSVSLPWWFVAPAHPFSLYLVRSGSI